MRTVALAIMTACMVAGCVPGGGGPKAARSTGMGIDPYGHTRMSEMRDAVSTEGMAHTQRLLAILRADLVRYRDPAAAERDGYRREGEDVPVGALKHYFNDANYRKNLTHLDPEAPPAILYRRTKTGYELAGVMFTAPIATSMDELDGRLPLALAHWHSHRNLCVAKPGTPPLSREDRKRFGFSGSIATRDACAAASGVFLDNVYGWMSHVYPYASTLADAF
jgi:hypothetical protein